MNWIIQNWIELAGAGLGFIYIFLEIKEKMWLWPVGIATSLFYIFVYFNAKFYADMSLQFYYIAISVYGWYTWKFGKTKKSEKLLISNISKKLAVNLSIITIMLFSVVGYFLDTYTDTTVPYWDALTTVMAVVATWMLARKLIEQWFVWIITNAICVGLYWYKDLYLTTGLFVVYFALSIVGYYEWLKIFKKQDE